MASVQEQQPINIGLKLLAGAHRQPGRQIPVEISAVHRCIEGNLDMALRSQIVDFIRFDFAHQTDQTRRIGQVSVVQGNRVLLNQMVDTSRVGDGRTADDAVDFIALLQQKLCQIRAGLSGNACNQCFFHKNIILS